MLSSAIDLVSRSFAGAIAFFQRIFDAIPGSMELIVVMFFISVVLGLLILPLRGSFSAGASDTVTKRKKEE